MFAIFCSYVLNLSQYIKKNAAMIATIFVNFLSRLTIKVLYKKDNFISMIAVKDSRILLI